MGISPYQVVKPDSKYNVMKTKSYNPSPLEVEFVNVIESLQQNINEKLENSKIQSFEHNIEIDNPILKANIIDNDGDKHTVILRVIQKPDDF
jgi:hypothetical protein